MEKVMQFNLTRIAAANGGDRYEHGVEKSLEFMVIYLPQSISRKSGTPTPVIEVTIKT